MSIIFILIISLLSLLWAANHLVTGASGLATRFQLSPLIMGLTVVAIGTSAPELIISILSALKNKNDLTLGNTLGSNIANIGLVIGLTTLIKPMSLNTSLLKKAFPLLIIAMLFVYSLILDGFMSKIDGCLFLLACIAFIVFCIYWIHETPRPDPFYKEFKSVTQSGHSLKSNIFSMCLGLLVLPLSSKYVIISSTELARWMGISDLTIGLTVVAIGTTLPELVTSITAALKGEEEIGIGTILGSNIYNLLLIMAFPAIINPTRVNSIVLWRDMPIMISLTILLIFLNVYYKEKLSRWHGGILLIIYCSYIISLGIRAHS